MPCKAVVCCFCCCIVVEGVVVEGVIVIATKVRPNRCAAPLIKDASDNDEEETGTKTVTIAANPRAFSVANRVKSVETRRRNHC